MNQFERAFSKQVEAQLLEHHFRAQTAYWHGVTTVCLVVLTVFMLWLLLRWLARRRTKRLSRTAVPLWPCHLCGRPLAVADGLTCDRCKEAEA